MGDFIENFQQVKIDSRYSLVRKLGEGGYGAVYLGRDFETGHEVALKLEHQLREPSVLAEEAEMYASLKDLPGFPQMYWYGWQDEYKILAMELLGPSLGDLFLFCNRQFSLKTVIMIMDQLIPRLEALHSRGLLHRDVKPENCLLGTGACGNIIYLTDFGLSREYEKDSVPDERYCDGRSHVVGTTSPPADDLEALGYLMIYFLRGRLPWQGLKAHDESEMEQLIMEKKKSLSVEELCLGLPRELAEYMSRVRMTAHGQTPEYAELRALFRSLAQREDIEFDNVFDWTVRIYLQNSI